jgi:hypothetical protein
MLTKKTKTVEWTPTRNKIEALIMLIFSTTDYRLAFQVHYVKAVREGIKCKLSRINGEWQVVAV